MAKATNRPGVPGIIPSGLDGKHSIGYTKAMAGDARFADVRRRLERAGYRLVRIHGSHHLFAKPGAPLLSIPVHRGKVKPFYVRQVEKIITGDRPDD